jgi:hypothetical protein
MHPRHVALLTLTIHFIHPVLCLASYLVWVRHNVPLIGPKLAPTYLVLSVVSFAVYMLISSVFYLWAYPEKDEKTSRRRLIYGIIANFILADFPIFFVEMQIVTSIGMVNAVQSASFVVTSISLLYSGLRIVGHIIQRASGHRTAHDNHPPNAARHRPNRRWDFY